VQWGICGCADVRMCGCADVRMCGCADVQMCGCIDKHVVHTFRRSIPLKAYGLQLAASHPHPARAGHICKSAHSLLHASPILPAYFVQGMGDLAK
jgi:hypothetical protein